MADANFPVFLVFGAPDPLLCETQAEIMEAVFETRSTVRIYRIEEDVPPREISEDVFLDRWHVEGPSGTYPAAFLELMDRDQRAAWGQCHGEDA